MAASTASRLPFLSSSAVRLPRSPLSPRLSTPQWHTRLEPRRICPARPFTSSTALQERKYTRDHEWIELEKDGKTGTIGITTYAAKNLGDVVFVELPSHGLQATQGDAIGAVESVKSASDILTPISGTIVGVNEALESSPGLINKDPEGEGGWIARLEVSERGRKEFETEDKPPTHESGGEKGGEAEGGEHYQGLMTEVEYGQFTAE